MNAVIKLLLISELLTSRRLHCRGFKKQIEICAWKNCFIII